MHKGSRIERCKRHLLLDILVQSMCAVTSGAEQWIDKQTALNKIVNDNKFHYSLEFIPFSF